jgi:Fe-S cluster biogenesis protein NfuA
MLDREKVAQVLDRIRPALQNHGGDVQLVEVCDDGVVKVLLEGACRGCPMARQTVKEGVQAFLQEQIPEVKEVVAVEPEGEEGFAFEEGEDEAQ